MNKYEPLDPNFEARIRDSFARQALMSTIGARLRSVVPGEVIVEMPFDAKLTQQNGFIHAGIVTAIADTACGYAAYTLMPNTADVLSVEYKINLMSPAIGTHLIAYGRVLKPGQTLTVCSGDVFAVNNGEEKCVATMLATMIRRERDKG